MSEKNHKLRPRTLAIHGGERPDPVTHASAPNLVMSTTYIADPDTPFSAENLSEDTPFFYSRWSNPTVDQLERKLALLEGAEAGLAFGSGMAAISALFFHSLTPGDHLVISDVAYAGAEELTNDLIPALGIRVSKVNTSDLEDLREAVTPGTKLVYIETPSNPILRLTDIRAAAEIAHAAGAKLVVDSTFATPVATRPIELGADYVIHSLTKYLCGHGDAIGGALLGPQAELGKVRQRMVIRVGGILSPFNAWLIIRGMATLELRMQAHQENAFRVAGFLEQHPKVKKVIYPGLLSHPQHGLAQQQMQNYSGMISFQPVDGKRAARALSDHLQVIHYAVSLGHQRSLIIYLETSALLETTYKLTPPQLEAFRSYAGDGIFRFSVGLEDPEDIIEDLDQALRSI